MPLVIVHRKTYVPYASALKVELPLAEALNAPVPPLTILQAPIPGSGVLPPNDPLTKKPQIFCVGPTAEIVGDWKKLIVTSEVLGVQVPLLMVQRNT